MAACAALFAAAPAFAEPPPVGSEDYEILAPFGDWIAAQNQPGTVVSCCNIGDGRIVEHRVREGHLQIRFVHPETLPDYPYAHRPAVGQWYPVPDNSILRGPTGAPIANPTGVDVGWWLGGRILCYAQANEG